MTVSSILAGATSDSVVTGQQQYTTPGTYSWVAPAGVTSVCVVCVGTAGSYEGSAGGLGWKNNIRVTPGKSYTVVVGNYGEMGAANGDDGGNSYFISTSTVMGGGGRGYHYTGPGGTYVGDGGGSGGGSGLNNPGNYGYYAGGGGAGGYSGNGGNGGDYNTTPPGRSYSDGFNGSGGGGGGGAGYNDAGGGGVGLLGQGTSGAGGYYGVGYATSGGKGGSGGSDANVVSYASYAGSYGGAGSYAYPNGATGAVRIIWGPRRKFPSTRTGNL